ncbi:MAG: S41 family peptidase [Clostridiaceae bacterium]|nr:S41 family peptidase [Clostridiaceae bacterium]
MKENKYLRGFVLGVSCCLLGVVVMLFAMGNAGVLDVSKMLGNTSTEREELKQEIAQKIEVLEKYIDQYYLDEIDDEKMADEIYKGVIAGLGDDYAAYYTEEEYIEIMEKTNGTYCGIGAYISSDASTGVVTIVNPMKNSPAEKAGVKAGDIIYAVDDEEVTGMEISKVQALVKGEEGSKVKLTIIRDNEQMELTVTRAEIEEDTVSYQMLGEDIGYIQVSSFEQVTPKQFEKAIKQLEKKGEKALIIDLRNNGGGLLDSAVEMLDTMLPEGVVVYSMDKSGEKQNYYAEDDDCFEKPVAILVNENSASASEVFCGAMQDEEAAVLVGTQTFGKGIVQGIFALSDGSAVKMTTAKYYTPKGRDIHGTGLTPDVEVALEDKTEEISDGGIKVDNQTKAAYDYLSDEIE